MKTWIFTTFCSTESYCFTVNYIVLPECGRHGVVSFSCGRPCQDREDLVNTFIKGILNRDFGRSHRWVTGGWGVGGVEIRKFRFEAGCSNEPWAPAATMVSSVEQRDSGSVISPSHDVQVQQKRSEPHPPSLHVTENSPHVEGTLCCCCC